MKKANFKKDDLAKVVTLGILLEYTDDFLIPKIADLINESESRIKKDLFESEGRAKHELKEYIDDKLDEYTTDIFKRLDKKYQKEKQF